MQILHVGYLLIESGELMEVSSEHTKCVDLRGNMSGDMRQED